jgi:hypothetical protein
MGGLEIPLAIAGWLLTAGLAGVGGTFFIQNKNEQRVEKVKESSDRKIEDLIAEYKIQSGTVLRHVQNVETMINNMRAELPEKYTLKSDHLRLEEKVEKLALQVFQQREVDNRGGQ